MGKFPLSWKHCKKGWLENFVTILKPIGLLQGVVHRVNNQSSTAKSKLVDLENLFSLQKYLARYVVTPFSFFLLGELKEKTIFPSNWFYFFPHCSHVRNPFSKSTMAYYWVIFFLFSCIASSFIKRAWIRKLANQWDPT